MTYRYLSLPLSVIGVGWRDMQNTDRYDGWERRHEGAMYPGRRGIQGSETRRYYSQDFDDATHRPLPLSSCFYDDLEIQGVIPRSLEQETFNNVPFGRALRRLFKQLEKAEEFYENFQREFNTESEGIKKYATADILLDLWHLKLQNGSQEQTGESGSCAQGKAQRVETINSKLLHCLQTAMDSKPSEATQGPGQNETDLDNMRRLQKKVKLAHEDINGTGAQSINELRAMRCTGARTWIAQASY